MTTVESALRSALGLCDYLARHWPEVGLLPTTQETRRDIEVALSDPGPRYCYAKEIATLRRILRDEHEALAERVSKPEWRTRRASVQNAIEESNRRIEALTAAIKAVGGAL